MPPLGYLLIWLLGLGLSLPHHPDPEPCTTFGRIVAVEHRDAWMGMKFVEEGYMRVAEPQPHPEVWVATLQYQQDGKKLTVKRTFEEEVQVGGGFQVPYPCSLVGGAHGSR